MKSGKNISEVSMAPAILGKRSRQVFDEEDIQLSTSPKRRSTRQPKPRIYEDDTVVTKLQPTRTTQDRVKTIPSVTRHNSRKGTTHDNSIQEHIEDENIPPNLLSTPSTVRFKDVLLSHSPATPRRRVVLAGKSITPRSGRATSADKTHTVYTLARQLFATSNCSQRLIGREPERQQLSDFLTNAINSQRGGCTYVSGPPGTGKSALVHELLQEYHDSQSIRVSTVNCVTCKTSKEAFDKLREDFAPNVKAGQQSSKQILANTFIGKKSASPLTHLVLLDEIDNLLDGDCDVLYSMFEWALHKSSSLVLIGIANALDLTDRFLPRLKGRNLTPQLLPFLPYTAHQVSDIITHKLRSLLHPGSIANSSFTPVLHPAAIQLCSKKISAQTGDLRKAFNLVRRTIDIIESETLVKIGQDVQVTPTRQPLGVVSNLADLTPTYSPTSKTKNDNHVRSKLTPEDAPRATVAHVARVASSIFNNGTVSRLNGLNLQQKAVLCSLVAGEGRRNQRDPYVTPSKNTAKVPTVKDLYAKYTLICKKDDGVLQPLKKPEFRDVVASLETLGLVHEYYGRATSLLTPTSNSSRAQNNTDEKQVISAVSEKEMRQTLSGAGSDLLLRLLDE